MQRSLSLAALVFSLSACTARTGATPTPIPASLEAPSAVASSPTLPQLEAAATQPAPVGEPPASQAAEIPGAEGLILRGVFYPAPGPSAPGVLLLHMYGGSKADWDELAQALQGAGFAALAIDLRGHGETGGTEDWALARQDVAAAYAWLATHEGVDGARVGVVGASIGANLALVQGAEDASVAAIGLLSPGFDYFRVVIEGLIEEYGDRPSFLAASEEDTYSAETVRALAASALGEAELAIYTGAGHGTAMLENEPDLTVRLIAFLARWLIPEN